VEEQKRKDALAEKEPEWKLYCDLTGNMSADFITKEFW